MVIRLCWLATCGVSSDSDRQSTDLQRDALLAAGVDSRHLSMITPQARRMIARAWRVHSYSSGPVTYWSCGNSTGSPLAVAPGWHSASLTENLHTTTPSGKFLFQVFGALAQYERALIQERVVAGLAAARKRDGSAHDRRRSSAKSWTPSSPHWMAACPRRRCAATSASATGRAILSRYNSQTKCK